MSSGKPTLTLVATQPSGPTIDNPASPDNLSVEALYHCYRHSLLNYLAGILPGGRQDAAEILHETYVRLLRQEDLERLRENPRAYIFAIATNLVRDSLRRRNSRMADAHVDFDEIDFPSDDATPTRAYDWEESLGRLKQSLLQLPVVTRQICLLSRFDELTYPEMAHALNISTRTVERHRSSAIKARKLSREDLQ